MTGTHESRNFFLDGPAGRLEAILWTRLHRTSALAAVVCHPHPLFGGTMHNKVVYQTAKSLDALGIPVLRSIFAALDSAPAYTTAASASQEMSVRRWTFLLPSFLVSRCYSQDSVSVPGSACASAAKTARLSPDRLGHSRQQHRFLIPAPVQQAQIVRAWKQRRARRRRKSQSAHPTLPGDNRLVLIEGVDHFFAGKLDQLGRAINAWLTGEVLRLRH